MTAEYRALTLRGTCNNKCVRIKHTFTLEMLEEEEGILCHSRSRIDWYDSLPKGIEGNPNDRS